MNLIDLLLISLALSLDAFAVALSCGMRLPQNRYAKFVRIALVFGLFQAAMPLAGSLLSRHLLSRFISDHGPLIASLVFGGLGAKTLWDHFRATPEAPASPCSCDSRRCLLSLGVATSIDAFLIGSVLGLKAISMPVAATWIGVITFVNALIGCFLGNRAAGFLAHRARLLAALILLLLAIKAWF